MAHRVDAMAGRPDSLAIRPIQNRDAALGA
jgi:hypothetical protein